MELMIMVAMAILFVMIITSLIVVVVPSLGAVVTTSRVPISRPPFIVAFRMAIQLVPAIGNVLGHLKRIKIPLVGTGFILLFLHLLRPSSIQFLIKVFFRRSFTSLLIFF